jgi:hypothetical protein
VAPSGATRVTDGQPEASPGEVELGELRWSSRVLGRWEGVERGTRTLPALGGPSGVPRPRPAADNVEVAPALVAR